MSATDPHEYWIYHERQEAMLCGQHALNNLVQSNDFSAGSLAELAMQLDQMELAFMADNNDGGVASKDYLERVAEGSGNVDPSGNFSIEVLRAAMKGKFNLDLPNIRKQGVMDFGDVTEMDGFICNKEAHWFAIRKINNRWWNLNSTKEHPIVISHFNLAKEIQGLQDSGYSVFAIAVGLPAPCTSKAQRSRGLPQFWWKEDDLLKGKGKTAINGATDPWKDVGSGMRLDGQNTSHGGDMGGMTEDEMMQMALAASLDQHTSAQKEPIQLTPEPAAGAANAVRIQFRLPEGKRTVRRFLSTDSVNMIYAYAEDESAGGQGRRLELRCGFPPKDLSSRCDLTIDEAALSGEAIQCRFV